MEESSKSADDAATTRSTFVGAAVATEGGNVEGSEAKKGVACVAFEGLGGEGWRWLGGGGDVGLRGRSGRRGLGGK